MFYCMLCLSCTTLRFDATELLLLHACKPDDQLMAEAEKLKRALQVDGARSCSGVAAADAVC